MDALPDQPGVRPPGAPHDGHTDDGALRAPHGVPLGQLLVERQLVTEEQLAAALAEQERTGKPLGRVLVDLELVNEATVAQALATQHGGVLKTEYGFATGFGGNGRAGALPMLEPLVSPDDPAAELVAAEGPKRPTIGADLPPPPPPAPAEPAVEEPEPTAVVTELFERRKDAEQSDPEPESPPVALAAVEPAEEEDEPPAVVIASEPEDAGDAEPAPLAESQGLQASAELLARVAELEATLEVVRLAAETAAAARTEARDAAEHVERLEAELAAAAEARAALQAEIERVAAAAEEFAADRELQEKLVRARLVEIEQRLDASSTPQS